MGKALEEMASRDTVTEEVEAILWKWGHELSERDLRKCLETALAEHMASIKEFANTPKQKECPLTK